MPRTEFSFTRGPHIVRDALTLDLDIPDVKICPKRHDIWLGKFDSSAGEKSWVKVGGSAFRLTKDVSFHHGTMIIDTEPTSIDSALGLRRWLHENPHKSSKNIREVDIGDGLSSKAISSIGSKVGKLRDHSFTVSAGNLMNAIAYRFLNSMIPDFDKQQSIDIEEDFPFESISEAMALATPGVEEEVQSLKSWSWKYGLTPNFTQKIPVALSESISAELNFIIECTRCVIKSAKFEFPGGSNVNEILNHSSDGIFFSSISKNLIGEKYSRQSFSRVLEDLLKKQFLSDESISLLSENARQRISSQILAKIPPMI